MLIISEIFQLVLLLVTDNIIISRIITDTSGLPFQLLIFSLTSTTPVDELFGGKISELAKVYPDRIRK